VKVVRTHECSQGHMMKMGKDYSWRCDICQEGSGMRGERRWNCKECDYDVCFGCDPD
jgi:hypothetical protein